MDLGVSSIDADINQRRNGAPKEKRIACQVEANLATKIPAAERERFVASL